MPLTPPPPTSLPLEPLPPSLLPFQCLRLTAKILLQRLRCQEDSSFKIFRPAFGGDHRGTLGGGRVRPNPPPLPLPFRLPPPLLILPCPPLPTPFCYFPVFVIFPPLGG